MLVDDAKRPIAAEKERPKLIFLWPYTNWGGAQVYFFAIMKLANEKWDVRAVLPEGSKPDLLAFLTELGVRTEFADIRYDARPESTLVGKVRRQYSRIRSEIKIFNYIRRFDLSRSVLHIEVAPWQSWLLLTALSARGAKTFVTLHNFRPDVSLIRSIIWKARFAIVSRLPGFRIFASNKDTKQHLQQWLPNRFWKDIEVTYTCVDPVQIEKAVLSGSERASYRERFGLGADDFVVLAVGQFIDRKGRWVFLDAAAKAIRNGSGFRFVWIMPEPITAEDQARIGKLDLGDSFVPILSSSIGTDRVSVLRFFRIADVFALPSIVEGLPIALLEAMALGIPAVSTDVYAIPEAVIDGETGILTTVGDSDDLLNAIIRLRNEPDLRSKLSASGRDFVLKNFDERDAAAICLKEYEAALLN